MQKKRQPFKFQIRPMKLQQFAAGALFFIFLSCGTIKVIEGTAIANTAMSSKAVIKAHKAASQEFETLAARMQVKYEDPQQSQSITTSLRIEKDKIIWIKASILGITLAKVLITPDQVQFYESIDRSYFVGDFSLISDLLGTQINFEQAQALLLGESMIALQSNKMSTDVVNNKYHLEPAVQDANYILSMLLNPDNFMVHQAQISQPAEQRNLEVLYGPYQKMQGSFYPTNIAIEALDVLDKTSIAIKYKKIDLNVSVSFPFTIPDGYTQRTFN
ncbi:MAG: hypothetical protein ACI849_001649 [Patiriisocius sp.]|jgi:hypothetical protein